LYGGFAWLNESLPKDPKAVADSHTIKNLAGFGRPFRFTQYKDSENQNRTHMKQTWNFKQCPRTSFYVLAVADAHCAYRIQHPGSDDHYLSFVETLEPTLRRRRSMRFFPSFGLAQLIQYLSQLPTARL
jgi:hypothetical protein